VGKKGAKQTKSRSWERKKKKKKWRDGEKKKGTETRCSWQACQTEMRDDKSPKERRKKKEERRRRRRRSDLFQSEVFYVDQVRRQEWLGRLELSEEPKHTERGNHKHKLQEEASTLTFDNCHFGIWQGRQAQEKRGESSVSLHEVQFRAPSPSSSSSSSFQVEFFLSCCHSGSILTAESERERDLAFEQDRFPSWLLFIKIQIDQWSDNLHRASSLHTLSFGPSLLKQKNTGEITQEEKKEKEGREEKRRKEGRKEGWKDVFSSKGGVLRFNSFHFFSSDLLLEFVIEIEPRFQCPNSGCSRSFKTKPHLNKHMKDCGREFICPNTNCGKIYKSKSDLTQHVKDCGQSLACSNPGCSKSFNSEGELSNHLRVCGGDSCPCGYEFRHMKYLVLHQTTCKVSSPSFLINFIHSFQYNNFPSPLALLCCCWEDQEGPLHSSERGQVVWGAGTAGGEAPFDQSSWFPKFQQHHFARCLWAPPSPWSHGYSNNAA